jgi:hypothetical protein
MIAHVCDLIKFVRDPMAAFNAKVCVNGYCGFGIHSMCVEEVGLHSLFAI